MSEEDALQELMLEYKKSIPEKLRVLEKLIADVHAKGDLASVSALRFAVHKLAGSAGSYGFTEVSELCLPLDKDLHQKMESFQPLEKNWHITLDQIFEKVKAAFAKK
ncbi:MAG: Hpt domain-containing protein [Chlamydiota bacterium]